MYICLDCGHIFDEGEESNWSESYGEFWGVSCSRDESGCPLCRGDYTEAVRCERCNSYHHEDDLYNGVCDDCIEEYNNVDDCFEIGKTQTEEININCFLYSMFDVDEIEAILYAHLKNAEKEIDCSDFINQDRSWFAEKILEMEDTEK